MATLREIRSRISGVKSTQKITKAMKMVAAAKLRRAQEAVIAARPYARKMNDLLQHLAGVVDVSSNPLFAARPVKRVALVVVTADRGLCGAFNTNIVRAAASHIRNNYADMNAAGNVRLVVVGRKGHDALSKDPGYVIADKYIGIFAGLHFGLAQEIVAGLVRGYLQHDYDRVELVYNEFKSIIQQRVVIAQLLPIPSEALAPASSARGIAAAPPGGHPPSAGPKAVHARIPPDYIYEPSGPEIISALVPQHLNFQLWHILLESFAAEQGARMTAMDNATTNASDLIRDLQLSYNKARQASITKELLEIVSGAEALKQAG